MANPALFNRSRINRRLPEANAKNHANARAYALNDLEALAQMAATGCFSSTFYASAEEQLSEVLQRAQKVPPPFLAKLAVYSRQKGQLKDMPAMLLAILSMRDKALFEAIFFQVVDSERVLRTFVQIMRSGAIGRKSLGSQPRRLIRTWLSQQTPDELFKMSVGQNPSLGDVLRLVHPRPDSNERRTLYGFLTGRQVEKAQLPPLVQHYLDFKSGVTLKVPPVPFQMLTSLPLSTGDWKAIARNGGWHMVRMNLNTFLRHGVLDDETLCREIAKRLSNRELIRRSKVFPYQMLASYLSTKSLIPERLSAALEQAMEHSLENVPRLEGQMYVMTDVSGSMMSPITGWRLGANSAVRCIDVAALMAAALVRKNRRTRVLAFNQQVVPWKMNESASVMKNAEALASVGGGGTDCSAPLKQLNREQALGDLVIYVSDNESWVDDKRGNRSTSLMLEWECFKRRNPRARLVCIDLTPNITTQAITSKDVLNIGGFSDQVFLLIGEFAAGRLNGNSYAKEIDRNL